MKELVPIQNEKNNAYNRILRFYTEENSGIVLTAEEDGILKRWIHCDKLILSRKFKTEDIAEKIKDLFGVSKMTAQNDIAKTQLLFGAVRRANKEYLLIHHADEIALQIERIKYDKTLAHLLPKLNDSYTKAVAALPDESNKNVLPPPVFLFNLVNGQNLVKPMEIEDARAKAKDKLKEISADNYIDFEDQPNGS